MDKDEPYSVYYSVLSVIQPARLEEIEESAIRLLGARGVSRLVGEGLLRQAHIYARNNGLVEDIGSEKYVVSERAEQFVRYEGWGEFIDNRRLFAMKSQRRDTRRYSRRSDRRKLSANNGES